MWLPMIKERYEPGPANWRDAIQAIALLVGFAAVVVIFYICL